MGLKLRALKRRDFNKIKSLLETTGYTVSDIIKMVWPDAKLVETIPDEDREDFISGLSEEEKETFNGLEKALQDKAILKAIAKRDQTVKAKEVILKLADDIDEFADKLDALLADLTGVDVETILDLDLKEYVDLIMETIEDVMGKNSTAAS